jgi:putative transposase
MKAINAKSRKSIRLKEYDYSTPGEYFVTVCTYNRICIFGDVIGEELRLSKEGTILQKCLEEIPKYYPNIELDTYVIMPNHVHGIINIIEPVGAIHESPLHMTQYQRRIMKLSKIIGRFKMISTKK